MVDLYETLGVQQDADKETIKKAYRNKAQKAHPDKGGKSEEFHAIQRAYGILSDDEKRARYDETGDDEQQFSEEDLAYQKLAAMIVSMVDSIDIERNNVFELIAEFINKQIDSFPEEIRKLKLSIKKREKAIKRIKRKSKGENIIAQLLKRDIAGIESKIKAREMEINNNKLLLEIAKNYEHETIEPEPGVPEWYRKHFADAGKFI